MICDNSISRVQLPSVLKHCVGPVLFKVWSPPNYDLARRWTASYPDDHIELTTLYLPFYSPSPRPASHLPCFLLRFNHSASTSSRPSSMSTLRALNKPSPVVPFDNCPFIFWRRSKSIPSSYCPPSSKNSWFTTYRDELEQDCIRSDRVRCIVPLNTMYAYRQELH